MKTQRDPNPNAFFQVLKGTKVSITWPDLTMKQKTPWPFPPGPKPQYLMGDFITGNLTTNQMNPYKKAALERAYNELRSRQLTDQNRRFLLERAKILGVGVVHIFDEDDPKGGMTVAFRKVSPFPKGTMVEVAVATCSREDAFCRKTGTKLALEMFFDDKTIKLPLNSPDSIQGLSTQVKWAFEAMFYTL